ncbi:App1 family protein [Novipirellula caenicola]|uniref:Phosphatidate phosphatase APP1 catalytic domain-containing protein n=1 Tax=Novipirellula caenicola TaxID=1536901 RepID=A0ABP9VYA7_9BACT
MTDHVETQQDETPEFDAWRDVFKAWLTQTASSADDVMDSGVRRLRKRLGHSGVPAIQPYIGYADRDSIHLHGRVLTNPPIDPDFQTDRWWHNLSNAIRRFASDEVPNVMLRATAGGTVVTTHSDREGYFRLELPREPGNGAPLFWSPAIMQIVESGLPRQSSSTTCDVMYVPDHAKFGIISDIDDTILHTGAIDIATMAKLTFLGNARTRAPLCGVAKLYEMLQHDGDLNRDPLNPIFYVSSSPWNLHDLIEDFLELNAIPKGPILLRDLGFDKDKFFKEGHEHKLVKTRRLLQQFDSLRFVLFGDSGQEDARLYAAAAKEFGSRIRAIFIRDIDPDQSSEHDARVDVHVRASRDAGVPMYLVKDSIEVARIAIEHQLFPPTVLDEVVAATQRDRQRKENFLQP